jgi:hypothetical protein
MGIDIKTLDRRMTALETARRNPCSRSIGSCVVVAQTFAEHSYPDSSAGNEVQSVSSTATGGSAQWTDGTYSTAPIPWNADAGTVQAALEALPSIGANNVEVTGGPLGTSALTITFVGDLTNTPQPTLSIGPGLTGGSATITETQTGSPPVYFAMQPLVILGAEVEGNQGAVSPYSTTFHACNLGSTVPPINSQVICTLINGRWFFRYDA